MASFGFGRCSALLVLGLAASTLACAGPPLAVAVQNDCATEALAEQSATQRLALLSGKCREVTNYALETPLARPVDVGPSLVKAKFGSAVSQPLFDGLLGTLKLNWAGQRTLQETALRTEQVALGAGGLLKLADFWSLQASIGREIGSVLGGIPRSRTSVASVLQPTRQSLLFAEWAENENGESQQRVGAQWWLMPKTLVLDVGARYLSEGVGWTDRRVQLRFQMTH
jgi:hypothetical protein